MSERDVRFDASAHLHLRDNGLLSLLLADNGIATLPRDIGDGRASSVARGRSGDVSTGTRFDSVIAVRERRMTWDVNRCPFSTRQTEADTWAALSNPVKLGLGSNDSLVNHQCGSRPHYVVAHSRPIHGSHPIWNGNADTPLPALTTPSTVQSQPEKEVVCLWRR